MSSKDGTTEEGQEVIDSDTLHRKFMAAVEKLQKNNATLLHENEKLKAEVRALKESADKEALLGRGSLRGNHGIGGGVVARRKGATTILQEDNEEDEESSDEDTDKLSGRPRAAEEIKTR